MATALSSTRTAIAWPSASREVNCPPGASIPVASAETSTASTMAATEAAPAKAHWGNLIGGESRARTSSGGGATMVKLRRGASIGSCRSITTAVRSESNSSRQASHDASSRSARAIAPVPNRPSRYSVRVSGLMCWWFRLMDHITLLAMTETGGQEFPDSLQEIPESSPPPADA